MKRANDPTTGWTDGLKLWNERMGCGKVFGVRRAMTGKENFSCSGQMIRLWLVEVGGIPALVKMPTLLNRVEPLP